MAKKNEKIEFVFTKGEAQLAYEALEEKARAFDKLIASCLREGLPEAAKPIIEELKNLQELRERLHDAVAGVKEE